MPNTIVFPPALLPQLTAALGDYACTGETAALEQCAFCSETEGTGEYIRLLTAQMLSGRSDRALYVLGDCYECGYGAKADPDAAKRCYEEDMQRGYMPAEIDFGHLLLEEDQYEDALAHFQNAMKQKDTLDELSLKRCYRWMGETYHYCEKPDYRKALECYLAAAEQFQDSQAIYSLGMLYQIEETDFFDAQKALSYLQTADKMHHRGAALYLAEYCIDGYPLLHIEQDLDAAEQYLLPHLDDTDTEVLTDMGGVYLRRAQESDDIVSAIKAIGYLTKVWEISKDEKTALDLASAYIQAGSNEDAEPYLEYADAHGEYRLSAVLAGQYYKRGEKKKALDCFAHAFDVHRLTNKYAVAMYLELLEEAGMYSQMKPVISYAVGFLRDSVFFYIECRMVLQNKLQISHVSKTQAAEILEELIEESSGDQLAGCHQLLGDYYHEIGKDYQAFDHWKTAVGLGKAECAVSLGRLTEAGYGAVRGNPIEAYNWFCKAADAGNELGKREKACFRMVTVPSGLFGSVQQPWRACPVSAVPSVASKVQPSPVPQQTRAAAFCRYCGAKLVSGARFCGKCGKQI